MKVLHVLSQRPSLTGSGVTLEALVSLAQAAGWDQRVVCGVPASDRSLRVGGLPADLIHPLVFGGKALDFPVPGMSDVMPYPSTRFSSMSPKRVAIYLDAWRDHLGRLADEFLPDVIHSHHVWLLSSVLKDVFPGIPVAAHCHATGLRQMELCPHLADQVRTGCGRIDRFCVLHQLHAEQLRASLSLPVDRIRVVGAGYREDLFHAREGGRERAESLLYVGKYSPAKGLPWLLDAVERLSARRPGVRLHVAGSGAGPEAEALRQRMIDLAPLVTLHGQLDQPRLADLMRDCRVCVLPSFYEGLPLVLVEALACGCRLVATDLPGVVHHLAPRLGEALAVVPLPALQSVDVPEPRGLPAFVQRLELALASALDAPPVGAGTGIDLKPFTWGAVFARVEALWRELIRLQGG